MAYKTYGFINKKTLQILINAGKKNFPTHKFMVTETSKVKAFKAFAKAIIEPLSEVKKKI